MTAAAKRKRSVVTYGKKKGRAGRHTWETLHSSSDDQNPLRTSTMSWVSSTWNEDNQPGPQPPAIPPRPTSQKEATMTVEPSAEQVQQIVEFVPGLDHSTAKRFLRVKKNSVEQALNAIFEGEDINKLEESTGWDESVWEADREGGSANDANLRPLGTSAAPTRGPSPAPALGIRNPASRDDEDRELQAAIAASQGMPYQQETGVVKGDGSKTVFGPAQRESYVGEWAMVKASTATNEVVPDTDALSRALVTGEPRLLKHLPDGDYTPNFLTILHSIPGARDALLLHDHSRADYGEDPDWWHGHSIPMPRIVHTVDGVPAQPDSDRHDEIVTEVQRLMAFLDMSDRNYATIGGLEQTDAIKNPKLGHLRSGSLLELFLDSWMVAASSKSQSGLDMARRFMTVVGTNASEGMDTPGLGLVELHASTSDGQKTDLLELMDHLLWNTDPDDVESADNYIDRPADILTLRLTHTQSSATQLGVEIPSELYLDKYLQENIAASRTVRREIAQSKRRIAEIEAQEKKLMFHPNPKNSTERVDARLLLRHTLGHFNGQNRLAADKADDKASGTAALVELPPHYHDIAARLEGVIQRIDDQLVKLAEEKEQFRKAISDMSKCPPPSMESSKLGHRYTLRGVATKPNITYLLRPKVEGSQLVDVDEEMPLMPNTAPTDNDDDTTPPGMQWWRIDYENATASSPSAKITKTKTPDYDVLRAAELEHNSALLVYANERAGDRDLYPNATNLSPALKTFVTRDNAFFENELALERNRPPAYDLLRDNDTGDAAVPSIEKRASLDSTRAELDFDDIPQRHQLDGVMDDHENVNGYDRAGDAAAAAAAATDAKHHQDITDDEWAQIEQHSIGLGYGNTFSSPSSPSATRDYRNHLHHHQSPAAAGTSAAEVRVSEQADRDPPTVDILLDDDKNNHSSNNSSSDAAPAQDDLLGGDVEMVEKVNGHTAPLIPGRELYGGAGGANGDVKMDGAESQQ